MLFLDAGPADLAAAQIPGGQHYGALRQQVDRRAKHKLADRLGSAATAGEGAQNHLCAAQGAAVLAITAAWWTDPVIGLGIAAVSVREGTRSWRGDDCC